MPRDGSNVYTQPSPNVANGTTIESAVYNGFTNDVALDLNTPRPVVAGGTGASSPATGLFNLGGETATQTVTNYDTHVFLPGSFRSAASVATAPTTAAFVGTAWINEALTNPPANNAVLIEARDMTTGTLYKRARAAGVWTAWAASLPAQLMEALAYNGLQINGSMEVSQEYLGNTTAYAAGAVSKYFIDNFSSTKTSGISAAYTMQQATSVFPGYSKEIKLTVTTSQTIAGVETVVIDQLIEGYRFARSAWGTAAAVPVSVGFWVKSSVGGSLNMIMASLGLTTTATASYTIAANTATWVTATFAAQTTGSWASFSAGMGALFRVYVAQVGGISVLGTNGNTFEMTGLIIVPGVDLPTSARAPMIMRPFPDEFLTCQRYYFSTFRGTPVGGAGNAGCWTFSDSGSIAYGSTTCIPFSVPMRTSPSLIAYNPNSGATASVRNFSTNSDLGTATFYTYTSSNDRFANLIVPSVGGTFAQVLGVHIVANARL